MKKTLITTLLSLLLLCHCPAMAQERHPWSHFGSHTAIIKEYLHHLRCQQLGKAYFFHSSRDFRKNTSFDAFRSFLNDHPVLTDGSPYVFTMMFFRDEMAVFQGYFTSREGQRYTYEFDLIEEDGKWKIWGLLVTPYQE